MVDISLHGRVGNRRLTKDKSDVLLDIDAYHHEQVSEEICTTNSWENITSFNTTTEFSRRGEVFINQWSEGIEELRELG